MKNKWRKQEEEFSPRQMGEEDSDGLNSSHSRGYTSIYRKKQPNSSKRSRLIIGLALFIIIILLWSYDSAANQQSNYRRVENQKLQNDKKEKQKAVDQQMQKQKDNKIQQLQTLNQQFKKKLDQTNLQINKLKEQLKKIIKESTPNSLNSATSVATYQQLQRMDKQVSESDKFLVPKIVWVYQDRPASEDNYVIQRSMQNKKWYAQQSGFEFRTVTKDNYGLWLNPEQTDELAKLISDFQNRKDNNGEVAHKFQKVRQNLIILHLLHRFGGVFIGRNYIFTEKLNWLENIKSNVVVNTGNPYAKPKVFSFYAISEGPSISKHNKKVSVEVDKFLLISPAAKDFFIAAQVGTAYIADVLAQYIILIQQPQKIRKIINDEQISRGQLNIDNIDNAYTVASHIVIQRRQKDLDDNQDKYEGKYKKFAIDQYGLFTINSYFYPDKMWFYFTNRLRLFNNFFNYAAKMAQDQFQDSIGPMRFIANPDPHGEFNTRIESARDGKGYEIVEGSFIHRHLFMDKKYDFIKPNLQKRNTAVYKQWQKLPKKLWLYWDSGSESASATNQLCIFNLIKNAKAANYEVIEVNDANANKYISQQTLDRVLNGIKNAKMTIRPQTKSDFYRLALISSHGGIYLDSSYYFLQNFTWITQVSKEPTKYYFNRFGEVPKVLMQFHATEGGPLDWTVDETYNTKATWHLAYQSNFLAADKDSELVKDWFEMFTYFVANPYDVTENKMRQCNMISHKWTNAYDRYLTVMDALKAVMGCKQADIDKNKQKYGKIVHAADYYKFWSFNGFTGIQKFRFYNNYANAYNGIMNEDNILMYRYSQEYAQAVYGRIYKAVKLYGFNIGSLNSVISSQRHNDFVNECHPQSMFLKYLYNKTEHEFTQTNGLHVRLKT